VGKTAKSGCNSCAYVRYTPSKLKGTNIEEVKLVSSASNAIGKEQDISLQPGHIPRRILETCTWAAHF
jgi:hypothetical protein